MYDSNLILTLLNQTPAGHTLPQPFYTDPGFFQFDMTAVLPRAWLMVGFEAELPQAGSYLSLSFGPHPLLLVRDRDGNIRGFHNTCRHRGSRLLAEGHGRSPRIICPYHKWTYDLNGRLMAAPRMQASFRPEQYGLRPIRVELLAGCVYIALGDDAPDFAPFRAAAAPLLAPYRLAQGKLAYQSVLIEKANWKLVMENARECYHCAHSHPELRFSFPVTINPGFSFDQNVHNARYNVRMAELGLSTKPLEDTWWHVSRYPLNPDMESISTDGKPVVAKRLFDVGEQGTGGVRWAVEPNTFCHVVPDYAFLFAAIPIAPQETLVISKWLVHADAVEGKDYTVESLIKTWTDTNLQDRDLAQNNQLGVNGLGYVPGVYSEEAEDLVIRFANWYRAEARAAAGPRKPKLRSAGS